VVDADLGLSAAAAANRQGFKDLVARIALGEVGLIVSIEVTRLARGAARQPSIASSVNQTVRLPR